MSDDGCVDDGLFDLLNSRRIRKFLRIVNPHNLAGGCRYPVADAGRCRNQINFELSFQPFLDDFEMEQAEKATPKAEAERGRVLRLEVECTVVQPELFKRIPEQPV